MNYRIHRGSFQAQLPRFHVDGLYSNDPLKQFREENVELLTGRKYSKYVA